MRADKLIHIIYHTKAPEGKLKFKIKSNTEKYEFFYASYNGEYQNAGSAPAKFITTDIADRCFTGAVIGAYAQSDTKTTAAAEITRFAVE